MYTNNKLELLTIEELCELLEIGHNKAYELLKSQKIKAFRIGRNWKICRAAVDDYILTESKLI